MVSLVVSRVFAVMAEPEDVLRKVLKLKEQLSHTRDPPKIMKALKRLKALEIPLDTLVETGVGKVLNHFRKHPTVGNLAKSLISHWKKLVPQDHPSVLLRKCVKEKESSTENKKKLSLKENEHSEKTQNTSSCKTLTLSDKQKKPHCLKDKQRNEDSDGFLIHTSEEQSNNIGQSYPGGLEMDSSKHLNKERKERLSSSEKPSCCNNKHSNKRHSSPDKKKGSSSLIAEKYDKDTGLKGTLKPKSEAKSLRNEDFDPPTMSFESYLNYDQGSRRKRTKTCPGSRQVVNSNFASQKNVASGSDEKQEEALRLDDLVETPVKKTKISLQDWLNTPLPKLLPEMFSPPYATEFKAPSTVEIPQQRSDTIQFTGRRLNSKMQVYSGSKTVYLSKMRTLSLHEVGGIPFKILEPALARCTSEQLFRIEDCNPTFIEQSNHLWKKHCQKDFRNEQPLEHESWREMYLRVFNQREEKLKFLTRSILSAQSEKPKARQVKMAFVHCMAKPPRNVRRQQEIHGTAGSVQSEMKHPENGERSNIFANSRCNKGSGAASASSSSSANGTYQDGKKASKKIAPMMRKSLRAFKNKVGRR